MDDDGLGKLRRRCSCDECATINSEMADYDLVEEHGKAKVGMGISWECRKMREWWSKSAKLKRREDDWAIHMFNEHKKEDDAWPPWTTSSSVAVECPCQGINVGSANDGDVPVMKAATVDFEMADYNLLEDQECLEHACGPCECLQVSGVFTKEAWYGTLRW